MSQQSVKSFRNLSKSMSDLMIDKCESSFDRWLQIKFLPTGFKIDDNDIKDVHTQKTWFHKTRFDSKELFQFYSFKMILLWILSVFVLISYTQSECFSKHNHDDDNYTTPAPEPKQRGIHWILYYHLEENKTVANNINCTVLKVIAFTNFSMSSIYLIILSFYVFHVVESAMDFPWYTLEVAYSFIYIFALFALNLANSCTLNNAMDVVLTNIQIFIAILYCKFFNLKKKKNILKFYFFLVINRYDKCRSGRFPQDLSDDIDGDYIRRIKNLFSNSLDDSYTNKKFKSSHDVTYDVYHQKMKSIASKNTLKNKSIRLNKVNSEQKNIKMNANRSKLTIDGKKDRKQPNTISSTKMKKTCQI